MRHFAGVLVGILLLPAFFALNWAINFVGDNVGGAQERWWLLLLLVTYAVVGALAGIMLAWRSVSPIALLLGGVLIIAAEVMLALPVLAGMKLNIAQLYTHPSITDGNLLITVGVALIFGGFLPTRWHRPYPKEARDEAADDDDRYAGAELLPGGPGAEETATRQMPSSERYDATWGTGRNDYVDEPEQPYSETRRQQGTAPTGGESGYEQGGYDQAQYDQAQYDQRQYDESGYEQGGYGQADYEQTQYDPNAYDPARFDSPGYQSPAYEEEPSTQQLPGARNSQ